MNKKIISQNRRLILRQVPPNGQIQKNLPNFPGEDDLTLPIVDPKQGKTHRGDDQGSHHGKRVLG